MLITHDVQLATNVLQQGGVIAYPTEGVWGLGCHPFKLAAVTKILTIKQRPSSKGFILLLAGPDMLQHLTEDWQAIYHTIQQTEKSLHLTGPITWLVPSKPQIPTYLTGSHKRIAIRFTQHPLAKQLVAHFGLPLVSTSANLSGEPAVTRHEQLSPQLSKQLDLLLLGQVGNLQKSTPIYDLLERTNIRD